MRTGPELIAATKPFAHDYSSKSWMHLIIATVLHVGAFIGAISSLPIPVRLGFAVLQGLLLLRLFVIYHDQQHHAILPKSQLAEFLMRVFGMYSLSASSVWRSSHNHHHNHNSKLKGSHIGSFPVMTKAQFLSSSKAKRFEYLFIRHPLTILFGYVFMFIYGMCLNPFLNDRRKHWDCLASLLLHISIGAALWYFFGWQGVIFGQTIPHFLAHCVGTYLFYAQHNFPGVSFEEKAGWTYEKAALESSSFMKMSPIMAWFAANIGYHHIHHLNARIPFYRLPEVLRSMPEMQKAKTTSLSPIEIARCLRLKVWDPESQKMIGLRELQ